MMRKVTAQLRTRGMLQRILAVQEAPARVVSQDDELQITHVRIVSAAGTQMIEAVYDRRGSYRRADGKLVMRFCDGRILDCQADLASRPVTLIKGESDGHFIRDDRRRKRVDAHDEPYSPEEEWMPIPETRGRYEASSRGRIRATFLFGTGRPRGTTDGTDGEVLKVSRGARNYLTVALNLEDQKRQRPYLVAPLLLSAFVGPKPSKNHIACYLDGNRNNLDISNLKWLTTRERRLLAIKNGHGGGWTSRKKRIEAMCAERRAARRSGSADTPASLLDTVGLKDS